MCGGAHKQRIRNQKVFGFLYSNLEARRQRSNEGNDLQPRILLDDVLLQKKEKTKKKAGTQEQEFNTGEKQREFLT